MADADQISIRAIDDRSLDEIPKRTIRVFVDADANGLFKLTAIETDLKKAIQADLDSLVDVLTKLLKDTPVPIYQGQP
ncbi:MAG: hypothetical protein E6R03_12320 [Hyphomicrobiaceae bacterium]|nr:MAG: hypothetical protein E6R03_12320 [Hyphomicrobiaceae bacterium]